METNTIAFIAVVAVAGAFMLGWITYNNGTLGFNFPDGVGLNIGGGCQSDLRDTALAVDPNAGAIFNYACTSAEGDTVWAKCELACYDTELPIDCADEIALGFKDLCEGAGAGYHCDAHNVYCKY